MLRLHRVVGALVQGHTRVVEIRPALPVCERNETDRPRISIYISPFRVERQARPVTGVLAARMCAKIGVEQHVSPFRRQFHRIGKRHMRQLVVQRPHHLKAFRVALCQSLQHGMRPRPDYGAASMRRNVTEKGYRRDAKSPRKGLMQVLFDGMIDVWSRPFPFSGGGNTLMA